MNKINLFLAACLAIVACCENRIPSEESVENQIPILAWDENNPGMLTAAHYSYPVATLEDIRLQVYGNLAYGVQGIQYFNWMNVNPEFKTPPVEFTTGEKTAVYAYVQQVNREIKALSPVFLEASVVWVRHTGENI
ncbi:MAG: hypothetical protein LBC40_07385 [Dysgonamonadaceae bacterium]|jgi:hypothetical protein|nr:hypothetical protein [Dysgonamonadaceae bacterium]